MNESRCPLPTLNSPTWFACMQVAHEFGVTRRVVESTGRLLHVSTVSLYVPPIVSEAPMPLRVSTPCRLPVVLLYVLFCCEPGLETLSLCYDPVCPQLVVN